MYRVTIDPSRRDDTSCCYATPFASKRCHPRAELDAAYFHLYGIERDDVQYILSTFTNTGLANDDAEERTEFLWQKGGTGELILEKYDQLANAKS